MTEGRIMAVLGCPLVTACLGSSKIFTNETAVLVIMSWFI